MTHGVNLIRLARLVREKRGDRGVRDIANEIGIGHATVSRVERRSMPDLETFAALCRWLPADPADFLMIGEPAVAEQMTPHEHDLKCDPRHFAGVLDGSKPFELRLDDRGYRVGDTLLLREHDRACSVYTGRSCRREVTSILRAEDGPWLAPGHVCMGLAAVAGDHHE